MKLAHGFPITNGTGDFVGCGVGASVGESVGDSVGASVGDSVGDSVGASVGDCVGDSVGGDVDKNGKQHTQSLYVEGEQPQSRSGSVPAGHSS